MSESTEPASECADTALDRPVYASRRERRAAEEASAARPAASPRDTAGSGISRIAAAGSELSARIPRTLPEAIAGVRRVAVAGGVMVVAAGLAVGMTVPSNALMATASSEVAEAAPEPAATAAAQRVELAVASAPVAEAAPLERDAWTAGSVPAMQMAAYQASGAGYAPGFIPTSGSIRWPFPYSTTMSSGYGEYRGDSIHNGLDFNPGVGAPIQAIADGVVTWVGWQSNYGFGYFVTVQHVIDGVQVESLYAHMIDGSSPLVVGQSISVGDTIGLVGNTGYSTGPHLHLQLTVGGSIVDPYAWLTENATNR